MHDALAWPSRHTQFFKTQVLSSASETSVSESCCWLNVQKVRIADIKPCRTDAGFWPIAPPKPSQASAAPGMRTSILEDDLNLGFAPCNPSHTRSLTFCLGGHSGFG